MTVLWEAKPECEMTEHEFDGTMEEFAERWQR
jgi:hypothetical protein